jgi:hypothetical protein
MLRSEMLRRVKEVNVPLSLPTVGEVRGAKTIIRPYHATNAKSARAVRITRNPLVAAGLVVHEELSEGLFEEINNIVDVNRLLATGERRFAFGDDIYYRIYAERQHVHSSPETFELLASTALEHIYAPSFYWLLYLPPALVSKLILAVLVHSRSNHVRLICRLAVLLGRQTSEWLMSTLQQQWKSHPQPPDHFFLFKKMFEAVDKRDARLVALQQSAASKIDLENDAPPVAVSELLEDPHRATHLLSEACLGVFKGNFNLRKTCRQLDVLAYGNEFLKSGEAVAAELATSA